MRRILTLLAAAVVATAGLVTTGLLLTGEEAPDPPAPAAVAPLSERDTRELRVPRVAFCDGVPEEWVADVLGATPGAAQSWENGGMLPAATGVRDVAHEFGCRWAAGGTAVAAWVFAPPVTQERARLLARGAAEAEGCTPLPGTARLGAPSSGLACSGDGGPSTATYAGLLGDAWLSCQVTSRRAGDLAATADRWCGMVLEAAAG